MQEKFLKDVINIVVGKQAEPIADLLSGKKYVNEFIIAKKLDLTINQTRNILYKLSDQGLVSFERKKDKKKGWYTYFWNIDVLKSLLFLDDILVRKTEQLRMQIKSRQTKVFYICKNCNIEFTEENAMHHDFICDECGEVFELKDNVRILKELERGLNKLEDELKLLREEIDKEKGKLDKQKTRRIIKDKKEKTEARRVKREAMKKSREKEKKKEEKMKPKKKKIVKKKGVKPKLKKSSKKKTAKSSKKKSSKKKK